ncbi:uncharacterized protein LOC144157712 [Haemaphysalis longicornis]
MAMGTDNLPQPPEEDDSFTNARVLAVTVATAMLVVSLTLACIAIAFLVEPIPDESSDDMYEDVEAVENFTLPNAVLKPPLPVARRANDTADIPHPAEPSQGPYYA